MKSIWPALGLSALLSACSHPGDASRQNFRSAVQDFYSQNEACVRLPVSFPYTVVRSDAQFREKTEILNELAEIGFLKVTKKATEKSNYALSYRLTDQGLDLTRKYAEMSPDMEAANFCYGHYKVDEVTNFTEPATRKGLVVSRVNYEFSVTDIAEWARDSIVLKRYFPQLAYNVAAEGDEQQGGAVLIQTNKGWVHEKLL